MIVSMKEQIDRELENIYMNEELKKKIRKKSNEKNFYKWINRIAVCMVMFLIGGITVFAGYQILNKMMVNETVLPELDQMYNITHRHISGETDEYGMVNKVINDYQKIQDILGITLLNSKISEKNNYMQGMLMTDKKDFAIITIKNYIIGDVSEFCYNEENDNFSYEHGKEFYSPITLKVEIILSQEQMKNGWDIDYLGQYNFVENYVSQDGYKVNIIEDTISGGKVEDFISEKCMIFVANGIRYTLRGRTSIENMKYIVDMMK